ncbi:co-chaperone DjlA [Ferrimonas gelatinilytica]|uniref:Co-chaperone DjlA n=1 Tax=Ferrimonas gelatinilytica TaxID=1255257 RepID=A0ABP9S2Z7_9GAMM
MAIWGKFFGAAIGFLLGRFIGALLGAYLGHRFIDQRRSANPFFQTTFAVMGHVAKSNGRVTEQDIALASSLMSQIGLRGRAKEAAQRAYRQGKAADYPLDRELKRLNMALRFRRDLARLFIEIQLQAALVDGVLDDHERALMSRICAALGFSEADLERLIAMRHGERHSQTASMTLEDACRILGVNGDDSLPSIKRAYRKLMAQHHPDKLASQGLPPEMLSVAQQKSQDIQAAWERIRASKA